MVCELRSDEEEGKGGEANDQRGKVGGGSGSGKGAGGSGIKEGAAVAVASLPS